MCGSGVLDVQWSYSNENIIASSHTDEKINLYLITKADGTFDSPIINPSSPGKHTREQSSALTSIERASSCCCLEAKMVMSTFGMCAI